MTDLIPFGRVLRIGSKGTQPVAVKRALWQAGYRIGWDSLGGAAIAAEVLGSIAVGNLTAFQAAHRLAADGVYGPLTHIALSRYFDDYAVLLYTGHPPNPPAGTLQLPDTFVPTHDTRGLPGYPAIDLFAPPGTRVLAPADGELVNSHLIPWNVTLRVGGWTTYLEATGGTYFLTHFGTVLASGSEVTRGQDIGTVGTVPQNAWSAHIHEGLHKAEV